MAHASPNRHATTHIHATGATPQDGPIPRCV
jgi:hypothetical protein